MSASEPTVAAIASGRSLAQKRRGSPPATAAPSSLPRRSGGLRFFLRRRFRIWLGLTVHPFLGLLIGLAGACSAFGRMVAATCLGLNRPRPAALAALGGAGLMVVAVIFGYRSGGAALILGLSALAGLFFAAAGLIVSRELGSTFYRTWLNRSSDFRLRRRDSASLCKRGLFRQPAFQARRRGRIRNSRIASHLAQIGSPL